MAKCRILIAEPLRPFAGEKHGIAAEGTTVGEVCISAAQGHPELMREVFQTDGSLRNGVTIFLNGADIRFKNGLNAAVNDGDVINLHAPMPIG